MTFLVSRDSRSFHFQFNRGKGRRTVNDLTIRPLLARISGTSSLLRCWRISSSRTFLSGTAGIFQARKEEQPCEGSGNGTPIRNIQFIWAGTLRFGDVLIGSGSTDGGAILSAILCVIYGGMALNQALPKHQTFLRERVAGFRVFQIIAHSVDGDSSDGNTLAVVRGEIEFRSVHFSYPTRPRMPVFTDFSLTVNAGEIVALVGSSGSGRSTLLMLIQRLYAPNSGSVLLDGCDIRTLHLRWLRRQIGFAGQDAVMFFGTIRQNILYGKPEGSPSDVEAAAVVVNAHAFISKLPGGYDTLVGESGIRLSAPQRRKIALARAIVNNPAILLLDEALSSLDAQAEQLLIQAFHTFMHSCTIITVAQWISTARAADTIVVINHGKVVETGSHTELLGRSNPNLYASFLRLEESKSLKDNDNDARAIVNQEGTLSDSVESSSSQCSFESGESSPLGSPLRSPGKPSSMTPESQNTSTPDSPSALELPPSPATPPELTQNTQGVLEHARSDERNSFVDHSFPDIRVVCKLLGRRWVSFMLGSLAAMTAGSVIPAVILILMNVIELFYSSERENQFRTTWKPLEGIVLSIYQRIIRSESLHESLLFYASRKNNWKIKYYELFVGKQS